MSIDMTSASSQPQTRENAVRKRSDRSQPPTKKRRINPPIVPQPSPIATSVASSTKTPVDTLQASKPIELKSPPFRLVPAEKGFTNAVSCQDRGAAFRWLKESGYLVPFEDKTTALAHTLLNGFKAAVPPDQLETF